MRRKRLGQAAVNAPSGQRSAAEQIRPAQARRQAPGESDRGRAETARGSKRVKRGQRERKQRQEGSKQVSSACTLLPGEKGSYALSP